jgi:hypothetical protein
MYEVGDFVEYFDGRRWSAGYISRRTGQTLHFKYDESKYKAFEEPIDGGDDDDLARLRASRASRRRGAPAAAKKSEAAAKTRERAAAPAAPKAKKPAAAKRKREDAPEPKRSKKAAKTTAAAAAKKPAATKPAAKKAGAPAAKADALKTVAKKSLPKIQKGVLDALRGIVVDASWLDKVTLTEFAPARVTVKTINRRSAERRCMIRSASSRAEWAIDGGARLVVSTSADYGTIYERSGGAWYEDEEDDEGDMEAGFTDTFSAGIDVVLTVGKKTYRCRVSALSFDRGQSLEFAEPFGKGKAKECLAAVRDVLGKGALGVRGNAKSKVSLSYFLACALSLGCIDICDILNIGKRSLPSGLYWDGDTCRVDQGAYVAYPKKWFAGPKD